MFVHMNVFEDKFGRLLDVGTGLARFVNYLHLSKFGEKKLGIISLNNFNFF